MMVFNVPLSDQLKERIKKTVQKKWNEIQIDEPIGVLAGDQLVVGYKRGEKVVFEQIVRVI